MIFLLNNVFYQLAVCVSVLLDASTVWQYSKDTN